MTKWAFILFAVLGLVLLPNAGLSALGFVWVALVGISWQIHVLEVKVNRLLDEGRIHVSKEEIND